MRVCDWVFRWFTKRKSVRCTLKLNILKIQLRPYVLIKDYTTLCSSYCTCANSEVYFNFHSEGTMQFILYVTKCDGKISEKWKFRDSNSDEGHFWINYHVFSCVRTFFRCRHLRPSETCSLQHFLRLTCLYFF